MSTIRNCRMFQPLKSHLQGVTHSVNHAARMYQLYSLKMNFKGRNVLQLRIALIQWRFKNVCVCVCVCVCVNFSVFVLIWWHWCTDMNKIKPHLVIFEVTFAAYASCETCLTNRDVRYWATLRNFQSCDKSKISRLLNEESCKYIISNTLCLQNIR
jgi:hypothetical protein